MHGIQGIESLGYVTMNTPGVLSISQSANRNDLSGSGKNAHRGPWKEVGQVADTLSLGKPMIIEIQLIERWGA